MKTKTTTVRLPKDLLEQIDEKCQEDDCNRNDWIKNALGNQIDLENDIDEQESHDQEPKEIPKATVTLVDNNEEEHEPHYDTYGNYWYYNYNTKRWTVRIDTKNLKVD